MNVTISCILRMNSGELVSMITVSLSTIRVPGRLRRGPLPGWPSLAAGVLRWVPSKEVASRHDAEGINELSALISPSMSTRRVQIDMSAALFKTHSEKGSKHGMQSLQCNIWQLIPSPIFFLACNHADSIAAQLPQPQHGINDGIPTRINSHALHDYF